MVPCGISWCIALTDKQFCPIHEKDQALHPQELDDDEDLGGADDYEAGYAEGFDAAAKQYGDAND